LRSLLTKPVVLVYHGVDDVDDTADPRRLIVSPKHLEAHVRLLLRRGYDFVTAGELPLAGPPPHRTAVLTFDDGWSNWLTIAVPLLERLGLRATFFVSPGLWGGRQPDVTGPAAQLLDEDGARALHEAGMELGSHSLSHPDLRGLDDPALARELAESKTAVEAITSKPCTTLAYPYGLFDERVERAAAAAGYDLAFAWLPGPWRRWAVPRMPGPPRHGSRRLALKLLGLRRPGR
jgi:peptidoglycan/xylan/chitin deacetylase (PgdA/CDA1 family)